MCQSTILKKYSLLRECVSEHTVSQIIAVVSVLAEFVSVVQFTPQESVQHCRRRQIVDAPSFSSRATANRGKRDLSTERNQDSATQPCTCMTNTKMFTFSSISRLPNKTVILSWVLPMFVDVDSALFLIGFTTGKRRREEERREGSWLLAPHAQHSSLFHVNGSYTSLGVAGETRTQPDTTENPSGANRFEGSAGNAPTTGGHCRKHP